MKSSQIPTVQLLVSPFAMYSRSFPAPVIALHQRDVYPCCELGWWQTQGWQLFIGAMKIPFMRKILEKSPYLNRLNLLICISVSMFFLFPSSSTVNLKPWIILELDQLAKQVNFAYYETNPHFQKVWLLCYSKQIMNTVTNFLNTNRLQSFIYGIDFISWNFILLNPCIIKLPHAICYTLWHAQ